LPSHLLNGRNPASQFPSCACCLMMAAHHGAVDHPALSGFRYMHSGCSCAGPPRSGDGADGRSRPLLAVTAILPQAAHRMPYRTRRRLLGLPPFRTLMVGMTRSSHVRSASSARSRVKSDQPARGWHEHQAALAAADGRLSRLFMTARQGKSSLTLKRLPCWKVCQQQNGCWPVGTRR